MDKPETLEEFYQRKFSWLPENIRKDIGHFNMFRLEQFYNGKATSIPYRRRDFFKIMLVKGRSEVFFADQVIEVKRQALAFSNPLIPYKWEHHEELQGQYCIFNQHFMSQFGNIMQYEVFQPTGNHVFELEDQQVLDIEAIFQRMEKDFQSDYKYRYDSIRNLIFELIHYALKLQPNTLSDRQPFNAAQRISAIFLELLERQFPIEDNHPQIELRTASEFAEHLNVHVNHLNRALKETTGKTTSQVIAERLVQEAKVLLKHSKWNISEIAFALGFVEVTHFNNFFKKHVESTPTKFREV
ncbi:Transcriptional regulator, AraC family [Mariniradius saccharolyticus AK6]|uniref:Transcriptional regulator, AraC family n=1 Tax=Mariniradius saccharolyticus AK6 TaxID=1239962 RepID=M7XBF5_9BACT|nr:AraC family transcriptional regulator [Mariniradius saccharolyticus]EMS32224.1 Transcriptional regulator, AraC family [Mariniradius saccharolyticus AK6]